MTTRENDVRGDLDRELTESRAVYATTYVRLYRAPLLGPSESTALATIADQVPDLNAELDAVYRAAAAVTLERDRLRAAVARVRAYLDDNAHMMRPEDVRALVDALEVGHG